jgi:hypothetical protein
MSVLDDMKAREAAETNAIREILGDRIDAVVAARDFGAATASKRGRNPKFPYVPVIKLRSDGSQLGGYGSARTRQLTGLAYATRDEAVARAQAEIDAYRRGFATDLCRPTSRALREHYGLPRKPLDPP